MLQQLLDPSSRDVPLKTLWIEGNNFTVEEKHKLLLENEGLEGISIRNTSLDERYVQRLLKNFRLEFAA